MEKFIKKIKKAMNTFNSQVKAKTGMDFNFAVVILGVILFIILIIVVKGALGWVKTSLMG